MAKRKSLGTTLDLGEDAVRRILDAVDRLRKIVPDGLRNDRARFEEFRHQLSCARWTFVDLQLEQREPSGRRKRTALEELTKAALRFCKAFDTFESEGRPGLEVLKYGAEHHCLEVKNALERVQLDLMRTHLRGRGEILAEHHGRIQLKRRDVGSAEKEELSRRRRKLYERKQVNDLLLFAYQDWDFKGIFNYARRTADAVASWLPAAEKRAKAEGKSVDKMLASAREGPKHVRAMPWLIGDRLPEIYKEFVGRKYAWGSIYRDGRHEADSPAIRFALQTIEEFGIVSERGRPYTADAIKNYWPGSKVRSNRV